MIIWFWQGLGGIPAGKSTLLFYHEPSQTNTNKYELLPMDTWELTSFAIFFFMFVAVRVVRG
jgi:hypothetical protein